MKNVVHTQRSRPKKSKELPSSNLSPLRFLKLPSPPLSGTLLSPPLSETHPSVFWNPPLLSLKDKNKGLSLWFFSKYQRVFHFIDSPLRFPSKDTAESFFSLNSGSPRVVDRSVIRPHVEKNNSRFFFCSKFFFDFFLFKFFFLW